MYHLGLVNILMKQRNTELFIQSSCYNKYHLLTCILRPCRQKHNILRKSKRTRRLTSPVETRVTLAHQVAVWLRSPERGTSCRCRSPEWSPQQPSVPWRRRSAGRGSCSAVKWTVTGYLWTDQSFRMQNRCCVMFSHRKVLCAAANTGLRKNELLTEGGKPLLDMFLKILLSLHLVRLWVTCAHHFISFTCYLLCAKSDCALTIYNMSDLISSGTTNFHLTHILVGKAPVWENWLLTKLPAGFSCYACFRFGVHIPVLSHHF